MELSETWNKGISQKALENLNPALSTISITQNQNFEDEHTGVACLCWEEDDRVVRAATTAASLEAKQEKVNTSRIGEDSMEHQDDLTDFVPPTPYDLPLSGGHTPGNDEVNVASVIPDVSVAGPYISAASPSTSTAEDIFKDEMITMADTLMAIRRTRQRTTSVVIQDVEEEPKRVTPPPTVQS
nr:hypothetical protein [Tanacetum cinerariifolium]